MSSKFWVANVLDYYDRLIAADVDTIFRRGCVNAFDLCADDEFGACDEMMFHQTRPQFKTLADYQSLRRTMGFQPVPNPPWYFNAGVMVVPRSMQFALQPPAGPIPARHCAEQDYRNAIALDRCKVRLLDRRANWQHWTDHGFKHAPADAILHCNGLPHARRIELMKLSTRTG